MTPSNQEATIRQQLANGKSKVALDAAKILHKAQATAASEALLIDAYAARIGSLFEQNMVLEARSLMDLVRQRYPAAQARLDDLNADAALRRGSLDELVKPLNDPRTDPAQRTVIEQTIRQQLRDPRALAKCETLPLEHPLRQAAGALDAAFRAVTSGPVTDEQVALPEISHRSPLAPWKMLVLAIAAFHRKEDDKCGEYLDAIDPQSAAARIIPPVRAVLGAAASAQLAPGAAELAGRFTNDDAALRQALNDLDEAFGDDASQSRLLRFIRAALAEARKSAPQVVEDLKGRLHARSWVANLDPERVNAAMEGGPRKCAALSRMVARGLELDHDESYWPVAGGIWDEFRMEAIREKWIPAGGMEEATVYLHIAGVVCRTPRGVLKKGQHRVTQELARMDEGVAHDQERSARDRFYLYPEQAFERACRLVPHSEGYSQWHRWASQESVVRAEAVAKIWSKAIPADIEPVLYLMQQAEKRKAYPTALGYLTAAERIDGVNPVVRAARLRLLVRIVLTRLRKNKPDQARVTLEEMAALPQAQSGDRPALVAALQCVVAMEKGEVSQEAEARTRMTLILGSEFAGEMLVATVCHETKLPCNVLTQLRELPPATLTQLPMAVARVAILAKEFQLEKLAFPPGGSSEIKEQLRGNLVGTAALSAAQLEALARLGLGAETMELTYAATGSGLGRGEATDARFLLLRSRCLPGWLSDRKYGCAAAAAALGRLHRDTVTVDEAVELTRNPFGPDPVQFAPDQAREVARREKAAASYPTANSEGPDYSDLVPENGCQCADCRRRRSGSDETFDDHDHPFGVEGPFEDDDEPDAAEMRSIFNANAPAGMPREVRDAMFEMMKMAFEEGMPMEELLKGLPWARGGGGRKKAKKKGGRN